MVVLPKHMNVLFVASEVAPISQLGGLGDVVGSLPIELYALGVTTRVVIPFTKSIDLRHYQCEKLLEYSFSMAGLEEHVIVWKTDYLRNVPVYILENKHYLASSIMYRDFNGYSEQARYAFFAKAVLELIAQWDFQPDVIHTHDYFTGIIALYRDTYYKHHPIIGKIATVLTIHSIRAQGKAHHSILDFAGIKRHELKTFEKDVLGNINLLEQGILNADIITTVSPTYAKEVFTPQFGLGVEKTLKKRRKDFYGILNGIDVRDYDPRKRNDRYQPYGIGNVFEIKPKNKASLLDHFKLVHRQDQPLLSMVTRLDDQKGIDLLFEVFPRIMELDYTFVLLAQGRLDYIKKFKQSTEKYPDKIRTIFKFDHELSKLIYAGSDLFLMPSKFEPCGLTDMIAMRYGTLPIVHLVGGLKDVVLDGHDGFGFVKFNAETLLSTIRRAHEVYGNYQHLRKSRRTRESKWTRMVVSAMRKDFSWKRSARQYRTLYQKAMQKRHV